MAIHASHWTLALWIDKHVGLGAVMMGNVCGYGDCLHQRGQVPQDLVLIETPTSTAITNLKSHKRWQQNDQDLHCQ